MRLLKYCIAVWILCLLSPCISVAATTYTAASCEYEDVKTKIEEAIDGDTVIIPSGGGDGTHCIWTSVLSIPHAISLQGAGASNTIITGRVTDSYRGVIAYELSSSVSGSAGNPSFRVTGLNVTNNGYSAPVLTFGTTIANSNKGYAIEDIRVDHNTFTANEDANGYLAAIVVYSQVTGVVDNNTINGRVSAENGGQYVAFDAIAPTAAFGTADNLYFEDNVFDCKTLPISAGHGARYAARYNTATMTNTSSATAGFDAHGNMLASTATTIYTEVYGNYLTSANETTRLDYLRGGMNLLYFNKYDNSTVGNIIWEEWDDGSWNPPRITANVGESTFISSIALPSDISEMKIYIVNGAGKGEHYEITGGGGTTTGSIAPETWENTFVSAYSMVYYFEGEKSKSGRNQHIHNTYIWANKDKENDLIATTSLGDFFYYNGTDDVVNDPAEVVENREWWQQGSSFDGSIGVGCGALASRPETCTTGVAYWATAQSCSDLTDMVGVNPATPISGTLYKCTDTNTWTEYYTPYTYPHPLRGEGEDDETAPTLTSAMINDTTLTMVFSETVSVGAGGNGGFAITPSGGAATVAYTSGSGTATLIYTVSRSIVQGETITLDYTQPGDGIEDVAGNDLLTFDPAKSVTNITQPTGTQYTLTITKTASGCVITSSPSGVNCGSTCTFDFTSETSVTVGGYLLDGWERILYGGDCNSLGVVTLDADKGCTVTCIPTYLFN